MIQANELRIGNWIRYKEIPTIVLGINALDQKYLDPDGDIYDLKQCYPIPLTEEILLKCVFEKSSDGEHFFIGHFGFCLVYDGQDYCVKPRIIDDLVIAYCKNLHQLQNLYFALTGKELEVNL